MSALHMPLAEHNRGIPLKGKLSDEKINTTVQAHSSEQAEWQETYPLSTCHHTCDT